MDEEDVFARLTDRPGDFEVSEDGTKIYLVTRKGIAITIRIDVQMWDEDALAEYIQKLLDL